MSHTSFLSLPYVSQQIRVVLVDGEPWFVAIDVATILGYSNPQKAVRDHCKRAKSLNELARTNRSGEEYQELSESAHCKRAKSLIDLGGTNRSPLEIKNLDPKTKLIPEPDVYRLIVRSKLPTAEKFETWLFEEVLPTLRQTGRYEMESQAPAAAVEPISESQYLQLRSDIARIALCYRMEDAAQWACWAVLRRHMGVDSARKLPADRFDEAVEVLRAIHELSSKFLSLAVEVEQQFMKQAIRQGKAEVLEALERRLREESEQLIAQAALPVLH